MHVHEHMCVLFAAGFDVVGFDVSEKARLLFLEACPQATCVRTTLPLKIEM
jgi:hypothetical protein